MKINNIELPFTQERFGQLSAELTPLAIQDVLDRFASWDEDAQEDFRLAVAIGLILGQKLPNGGKAELSQIKAGGRKGQWRFKLIGKNGEPVEPTNERYMNRQDALQTLGKYFSGFELVV